MTGRAFLRIAVGLAALAIFACHGESPAPPTSPPPPAPPATPTAKFDVAVLVDPRGPQTSRDDIDRVFKRAVDKLLEKTGETMVLTEVVYSPAGQNVSDMATRYIASKALANVPEGILVFTNDTTAHTFGGYSIYLTGPSGFQSQFPSPRGEVGSNKVYIGAVEFDHPYARCGYNDNLERISSVSVGGECRNQPGTPCVQRGSWWVCSTALNDLYMDHDYFTATTIVHEFLHPFGIDANENLDHYGTPACMSRTGMTSAQAADLMQAQLNCGLCPDVFPRFKSVK